MTDAQIFPYFHPTTTIFVDDNEDFLRSLVLHLPESLAYQTFSSPEQALTRVNEKPAQPPLYARCFSHLRLVDNLDDAQRLIHLDLNLIEQEVSNVERFREVSVVVVDYDMPAMSGLAFVRQIKDQQVKKILLTGVADEKVAVKAFNEGLIDRFIRKHEPDAIELLKQSIGELERAYYADVSRMLLNSLLLRSPSFLTDPQFVTLFAKLCREQNVVEYYLVENPPGLLLVQPDGTIRRLMIASRDDLHRQRLYAQQHGAPQTFLDALANGEMIAYFFDMLDELFDPASCNWDEYFFAATQLGGDRVYCYAMLEDPPVDIEFDAETSNYLTYLDALDVVR